MITPTLPVLCPMGTRDGGRAVDILLVEDNPGDARLVEEAFTDAGLLNSLHVVTDGDEALDFVYQREAYTETPQPDVILLDWNLPRTSGDEVLAELKGDAELEHIPVVVLTGSKAHTDRAKAYELQASAYITKPAEPEEFVDTICSVKQFWLEIVRLPPDDD